MHKQAWPTASGLAVLGILAAFCGLGVAQTLKAATVPPPAFPLKVSEDRRYLVDQRGKPFFVMGDTPWFVQKLKIEDVRMLMDDRFAKGFNTLFLEILDDSRIPSQDGYGNVAFQPDTDITKPVEAYWRYAEQVMDEAEKRGLFIIMSELWYGYGNGLWMHHVKPDNAKVYGAFIGKRFARFKNLMWMHAGDRNPDANLLECTRILAREIAAAAPHHLHTVHNSPEFASARFHHEDAWLDVNLGYTYGASYLHILPEYERTNPVRPVILGETGYEDEPNAIERLPDAKKGDLWNPYRIRRNAWWAVLSGAHGYCAGTRLWRWEPNWREVMQARSTVEAPNILKLMQTLAWWKLVPDTKHEFVTSGFGEWKKADYATAALAADGSCGVVYLPSARAFSVDLSKLSAAVSATWFDPSCAALKAVDGLPFENKGNRAFTPLGSNAAGESDWVLVLQTGASLATKEVMLENFESYTNDAHLAKIWYKPPHGGVTKQTIELVNKSEGKQAMKWEYSTSTPDEKTRYTYSAICRVAKWDASGCNAAQFWLKPDGSGRQVTLQLNISDQQGKNIHDLWEAAYVPAKGDTNGRMVTIPFSKLTHNVKYADSPNTSPVFKPEALIEIAFYVGERGEAGSGAYFFDDIRAVNLAELDAK